MKRKIVPHRPGQVQRLRPLRPQLRRGADPDRRRQGAAGRGDPRDGLGACLGECPEAAIVIEERDADAFDEKVVEEHLRRSAARRRRPTAGRDTIMATADHHGGHHDGHHGHGHPGHGNHGGGFVCPSSRAITHDRPPSVAVTPAGEGALRTGRWPVKLQLVGRRAPFFREEPASSPPTARPWPSATSTAVPQGRAVAIQCPKFGEQDFVVAKLAGILTRAASPGSPSSHGSPRCGGLAVGGAEGAPASGKDRPAAARSRRRGQRRPARSAPRPPALPGVAAGFTPGRRIGRGPSGYSPEEPRDGPAQTPSHGGGDG